MANGHGGPRTPAKPAAVSGPGAQSRRTDGGPAQALSAAPDQPYGDAGQQLNDQRIAPMGGKPPMPSLPNTQASDQQPPSFQMPQYQGGDFAAPSNRPGEPITAGAAIGPGPGPSVLPSASPQQQTTGAMTQLLSNLMSTDTTGVMASLLQQAQARGV